MPTVRKEMVGTRRLELHFHGKRDDSQNGRSVVQVPCGTHASQVVHLALAVGLPNDMYRECFGATTGTPSP